MSQRKRAMAKARSVANDEGQHGPFRIEVHAKPRAKVSAVRGVKDGVVEVALAAPPVDGAANEELIRFLAERLGLPRRDVTLLRGESSRNKLVEVAGLDRETLWQRLTP